MNRSRSLFLMAPALFAAAIACSEDSRSTVSGSAITAPDVARGGPRQVTVLSRNLYIGTDLDVVIGALISPDPSDDVPAIMGGLAMIQQTSFAARAVAIADEIASRRPHIVGLQEVYDLDVDLTPLGIPAQLRVPFLTVLRDALRARGLRYEVAGSVTNTDARPAPGIRLIDSDVILVDAERVTMLGQPMGQVFQFNIGPVAPGVNLVRGWVARRVEIGGTAMLVVNTHLESGSSAQIGQLRAAQAMELAQIIGTEPTVILLGDLNDGPGSAMHQVFTGAGLRDMWADLRPGVDGFTCCHAPDLSNEHHTFDQRIDYVMARGLDGASGSLQGSITVTGALPFARLNGPAGRIWPSDHAGVLGTIRIR